MALHESGPVYLARLAKEKLERETLLESESKKKATAEKSKATKSRNKNKES